MSCILIVDNNEDVLSVFQEILGSRGYEVLTATNGFEALDVIRGKTPDIIVSDIYMPRMDGFVFCKNVKSIEALQNIPFVFFSGAYTGPEDEDFAMSLGAVRFIAKPFTSDEFISVVEDVLKKSQSGDVGDREGSSLSPGNVDAFQEEYYLTVIRHLDAEVQELRKSKYAMERENRELSSQEEMLTRMLENERAERLCLENEIRRLRHLVTLVLNSVPSVLVGVDSEGLMTQWNSEAEQATGIKASDALGRPFAELFPEFRNDLEKVRQAIRERRAYTEKRVSWLRLGEDRLFNLTVLPLGLSDCDEAMIQIEPTV